MKLAWWRDTGAVAHGHLYTCNWVGAIWCNLGKGTWIGVEDKELGVIKGIEGEGDSNWCLN